MYYWCINRWQRQTPKTACIRERRLCIPGLPSELQHLRMGPSRAPPPQVPLHCPHMLIVLFLPVTLDTFPVFSNSRRVHLSQMLLMPLTQENHKVTQNQTLNFTAQDAPLLIQKQTPPSLQQLPSKSS